MSTLFDQDASVWHDRQGPFDQLHRLNPHRLAFIQAHVALKGIRVLDVGCGGGILAEALAIQGACVTGIDQEKTTLQSAKVRSVRLGFDIMYKEVSMPASSTELDTEDFDLVCMSEVLEHVRSVREVLDSALRVLRPGGHLMVSTIHRNFWSWAKAIVGAEYALGLLPIGTHEYAKFIRPSELVRMAKSSGLSLVDLQGLSYSFIRNQWSLTSDVSVNYCVMFKKRSEIISINL